MRKKVKTVLMVIGLVFLVCLIIVFFFVQKRLTDNHQTDQKTHQTSTANKKKSASDLPDVSSSDWDLIIVNRNHKREEMNPQLTTVDNIQVDSRIASNVKAFLAAAQEIDPKEHLISGYRSVAYQEQLFNSYVAKEMSDRGIEHSAAIKIVETYSQPAGTSEHQTGLAIDMSDIDSLDESPVAIASKVQALAPQYGFVLRFPKGKSASTGIDYEDWHFRYVGVKNAEYMTKHQLTLEEYVAKLKKAGR